MEQVRALEDITLGINASVFHIYQQNLTMSTSKSNNLLASEVSFCYQPSESLVSERSARHLSYKVALYSLALTLHVDDLPQKSHLLAS